MNRHSKGILVTATLLACAGAARAQPAKNVIYLIADGAGHNTYRATGYWHGDYGGELVRGPGWKSLSMSTYPLRTSSSPGSLVQDPNAVYDSVKEWDTTPVATGTLEFQGYVWTNSTAPDSANTISSSMTGVKTYNNAVNVDGAGNPLLTFAEIADAQRGMATGVVSTVQWPDATPCASSGISNIARSNRTQIADQMLNAPYIDVIMGAGNPDYNNDGVLRTTPEYVWTSATTWTDLKDADTAGFSATWQLIQDKSDFDGLAAGTLTPSRPKILGVVKSSDGKQQYRSAAGGLTQDYATPPFVSMRTDVPTLSTMIEGALNVLPDNGFFLSVEQGEVDRAMHSNHLGRSIEAMTEFNEAVAFVDAMLVANEGNPNLPNYSNTLVIVTADHDHQLLGDQSDTIPFQPVQDRGPGVLPGAKFQTGGHSNHLVPIFAKGAGAQLLDLYANQVDTHTDGLGRTFGVGRFLDQAELFSVFTRAICPADLNGDGLADFADYLEFLNRFDASDITADYTGDGLIDFSDYLEFLNVFDGGC